MQHQVIHIYLGVRAFA